MKRIIVLFVLLFIGTFAFAQKKVPSATGRGKASDTKITEGASGVRRSIGYKFSTLVTDADPGIGIFKYNNDNLPKVSFILIDNNDISGEDQTNWYSTWDDTTGATARGSINIVEYEGKNVNVFNVTGLFIKATGYWKIPVEYISGTLPVNGTVYYYVFNRIAHKKPQPVQEPKPLQEPQVIQETKPIPEPQVVEEPKPVREPPVIQETEPVQEPPVVQATKPVQEPPVIQETEPVQEPPVVQATKPVQEPPVVQETKPVQEPTVVQEAKPVQEPPVVQETKPVQEPPVVQETKPVQEPAAVQKTKPVPESQVAEEPKPIQKPQETQPPQKPQTTQTVQARQTTQAAEARRPKQPTQPTQTTQTTQTSQTQQQKQTTQTTQPVQPAQTTQRVQSNQQITANQSNTASQVSKPVVVENIYATTSVKRRKCYRGIIEAGYAWGVGDYGINNFRFNFINGIMIGKYSSIGLGIGFRQYFEVNENYTDRSLFSPETQFPVFLDLRTFFSTKKITPYLALGIGNSAGYVSSVSDSTITRQEGLFFSPSGGIWFNISERFAVFAGIAYEMQKLEYVLLSDNSHYKKNTSSISLNIGIAF